MSAPKQNPEVEAIVADMREARDHAPRIDGLEYAYAIGRIQNRARSDVGTAEEKLAEIRRVLDALDLFHGKEAGR